MNSQVWNTQIEKTRRMKPRSLLYCTVISSKKLSSSLHTATSICARRRHALCRRFDPWTPKSTKPVILLGGTISTAVPAPEGLVSFPELASSSVWSDEPFSEVAEDEFSADVPGLELRLVLVLVLELRSGRNFGFLLSEGVDCVTALLFKARSEMSRPVMEVTVQCACPKSFDKLACLD